MKRKGILTVIVAVLLMSGFVYFFLNGNPLEKKKSKEIVTVYLEDNYPKQEFKIMNVGYYPGEGTYIVHVVSKDGKTERNIDVRNGKIITEGNELPFMQ